jgi:hypothetical protein
MTKNLGTLDRLIRLSIGILLLIAALLTQSPILAIFGIFCLYEAFSSWCVLYQLIGRNTCPLPAASPTRKFPLAAYYLSGMKILITAIILNIFASYLGWSTWYDILSQPSSLARISLDNLIYIIIFYPLALALAANTHFPPKV